jgi:galactokinase
MDLLESHTCERLFGELYENEGSSIKAQQDRYRHLIREYQSRFGAGEVQLFSAPGRAEIAGNHTDHNGGLVLAGSVQLDSIAAASRNRNTTINVFSDGFPESFTIDIEDREPRHHERETFNALLRGITSRFCHLGHRVGGFDACISSTVGIGSGLSSSASVEMLLGTVMNHLFNGGAVPLIELAKIGQYAENYYFGKPCGLMDQIACGYGGVVGIDFEDAENPSVQRIVFDFSDHGYTLMVVRTGSDHADLTEDYAAITREMRAVAGLFGKNRCRELSLSHILDNVKYIRSRVSDRALLRVYHFLTENERVKEQVDALRGGDLERFLVLVQRSGNSSAQWLQNSYSNRFPDRQPVSVARSLTEFFFSHREGGAFRVHGGGFAGTILVFVPQDHADEFIDFMENRLGGGAVTRLKIRPHGSIHVNSLLEGDEEQR